MAYLHEILGPHALGALAGLWALKLAVGYGGLRLWRTRRAARLKVKA